MNGDDAFLLDILRYSERTIRAARGRRLEELRNDETLQSLLIHPLLVIGEAVKGCPQISANGMIKSHGRKSQVCGTG
jgi:uncharacterized protein with HEPN domain